MKPRKSPAQARSRITYEAVREAAARILEGREIDALTTNHVAERAGISIGSLYQYFPNKEAILVDLIRELRSDFLSDIECAVKQAEGLSLEKAIGIVVRAAVLHHKRRPNLAAALEDVERTLPLDAETDELKRRIANYVVHLLVEHGVSNPMVAAQDTSAITNALVQVAIIRGETDFEAIAVRVSKAVGGYLQAN